jgi:hypothetical protein
MSSISFLLHNRALTRTIRICILIGLAATSLKPATAQSLKMDSVHTKSYKSAEPEFANEGEREDYSTKELFKREYKYEYYERYKGQIVIHGDSYQYNDVVLVVYKYPELKGIFEKGLFYPDIISQSFKFKPPIRIKLLNNTETTGAKKDTTATTKKLFYNMIRTDSLIVADLEELKFLETKPTQKRFRFWMVRKGFANPTVYFFELTNEKATKDTGMASFINGSTLTFFDEGWIII